MDLVREGKAPCSLILSAHKLDYFDTEKVRVVLAATDVTQTRLAEKQKDDLIREKHVLLQELQHLVANSLQIIASVLMQSARHVQSEETRLHLHDAHSRVKHGHRRIELPGQGLDDPCAKTGLAALPARRHSRTIVRHG